VGVLVQRVREMLGERAGITLSNGYQAKMIDFLEVNLTCGRFGGLLGIPLVL